MLPWSLQRRRINSGSPLRVRWITLWLPLKVLINNFRLTRKEAIEWAWQREAGDTMFNIVNTYTRSAQFEGLSAEPSYRLQKVGGMILEMVH
jgi:hypothetical protein